MREQRTPQYPRQQQRQRQALTSPFEAQYMSFDHPAKEQMMLQALGTTQERHDQVMQQIGETKAQLGELPAVTEDAQSALKENLEDFRGRLDKVAKDYNYNYSRAANRLTEELAKEASNPLYGRIKQQAEQVERMQEAQDEFGMDHIVLQDPRRGDVRTGKGLEYQGIEADPVSEITDEMLEKVQADVRRGEPVRIPGLGMVEISEVEALTEDKFARIIGLKPIFNEEEEFVGYQDTGDNSFIRELMDRAPSLPYHPRYQHWFDEDGRITENAKFDILRQSHKFIYTEEGGDIRNIPGAGTRTDSSEIPRFTPSRAVPLTESGRREVKDVEDRYKDIESIFGEEGHPFLDILDPKDFNVFWLEDPKKMKPHIKEIINNPKHEKHQELLSQLNKDIWTQAFIEQDETTGEYKLSEDVTDPELTPEGIFDGVKTPKNAIIDHIADQFQLSGIMQSQGKKTPQQIETDFFEQNDLARNMKTHFQRQGLTEQEAKEKAVEVSRHYETKIHDRHHSAYPLEESVGKYITDTAMSYMGEDTAKVYSRNSRGRLKTGDDGMSVLRDVNQNDIIRHEAIPATGNILISVNHDGTMKHVEVDPSTLYRGTERPLKQMKNLMESIRSPENLSGEVIVGGISYKFIKEYDEQTNQIENRVFKMVGDDPKPVSEGMIVQDLLNRLIIENRK